MSQLIPCFMCNEHVQSTEKTCPHCGAYLGPLEDLLDPIPDEPMAAIYGAPPWAELAAYVIDIKIEPNYPKPEELQEILASYLQECDMSVMYRGDSFHIEFLVQNGTIQTPSFGKSKIAPAQIYTIQETLKNKPLPKLISGKIICTVSFET